MNDEIKEILNEIGYHQHIHENLTLSPKELDILVDYITNLQEENNNLKEDFKRHIDRINELTKRSDNLQEENEDLKDYLDIFKLSNKTKQETIDDFRKRVDKAVEILKDTSVDMPETLLIETIDYARYILTSDNE